MARAGAAIDVHQFDARQDQHRPDKIEQLAGDEHRSQRKAGGGSLGGEADGEVSDEHEASSGSLSEGL